MVNAIEEVNRLMLRAAHGIYEALKGRCVEITDEPSTKPYGIDFGIRDPFGNAIRIGQMFDN